MPGETGPTLVDTSDPLGGEGAEEAAIHVLPEEP
jgi:hypothetical protein